MKNYIYKILACITLTALFSSCEEYLIETNPNEISEDSFWKDLIDTDKGLTAVYGSMLNQNIYSVLPEAWRSDLAFPNQRNKPTTNLFYKQLFNNNVKEINNRWIAIYQIIWRANQVIDGLNGLDAETKQREEWVHQMGQARFFRGLGHFYAHSVFNNGRIIIRDKIPANSSEIQIAVSTSKEVRDFFRADLEYAYKNLPAQFEQKARVDAGVAATALGTSYLYEGKYAEAKVYFEDVLTNPDYGYELVQNTELMFTSAGDFNSESIFELNYGFLQVEDTNFDEESFFTTLARSTAASGRGGGTGSHTVPSAWLTEAYASEAVDAQDSRNYVENGVGGVKLRNVSLRASAMIALVNDEDTPFYLQPSVPLAADFGLKFSFFKHFSNHDIISEESLLADTSLKSPKNFLLNRLGHVYLMQAECFLKTGDLNGALALINKIRARWGLRLLGLEDGSNHDFDGVIYTEETLMERLMNVEKPLETSIEGFSIRNIDMQRWGIAKARFEALAATNFYLINYEYKGIDGELVVAKNSRIVKSTNLEESNYTLVDMEYNQAAQFYDANLHAYLPLPSIEVLNNNKVLSN